MHRFYSQNGLLGPKENFFRKPISKPCCVHSCLSTCRKSETDVNLLTRYWWLKNTGIWLAESFFGHNLRTRFFPLCSFHRMSKGNKYFYSTPFPDKTNEQIFLKSSKPPFLGHFCWKRIFPKKSGSVTHISMWAPKTI